MPILDRIFKGKIDREVAAKEALIKAEMDQRILQIEERMVEVSERQVAEKTREFTEQFNDQLEKARKKNEDLEAKSLMSDPFQLLESLRYKERPMMLTYEVLRSMAERNPIIASIIQTRANQVSSFSSPPKTEYDIGFEVVLRDDEAKPSKTDEKRIKEIETMIENTGVENLFLAEERDNFDTFLRKITRDTLTYDQMAFEIINGRAKNPIGFIAIDAATIRLASTARYFKDIKQMKGYDPPALMQPPRLTLEMGSRQKEEVKPEDIRYVQILEGKVVTTYTEQELGFGIRNARTNIKQNGYGVSELEILVNTVTAHLWAEEYNRRFFSQGSAPKGIISFEGSVPQEQLNDFRRQWHAQVMGVFNSWKTPVVSAPAKLNYTNLQLSNRSMEFSNWIDYLIKISCAVYLIDPAEIGFDMRGGAQASQPPVFESHQDARLKMSKDRGLRPLLKFLQSQINKNTIFRLDNSKFEFEFVGLDTKTEEQLQEMHLKEVQNFKTIDEIRIERDLIPLGKDRAGDVIMNSAYLGYLQQLSMAKMQQDQMAGGDMGGPEEGEEEDFGEESSPDFGEEGEEPFGVKLTLPKSAKKV